MSDWKVTTTKPHDATAAKHFHHTLSIWYNARNIRFSAVGSKVTGVGA